MKISEVSRIEDLMSYLRDDLKLVIFEGFENVGKSRIIGEVIRSKGWDVYRPDYSFWNKYFKPSDRWLIFLSAWDVLKLVDLKRPLLIDRGLMSGAVYSKNSDLARLCGDQMKDLPEVLHILVKTDKDSFYKMQGVRQGSGIPKIPWAVCEEFTQRFENYMNTFGVPYIEYFNKFDREIGDKSVRCCGGCDSFSVMRQEFDSERLVGRCSHWGREVYETSPRCDFYKEGDVHGQPDKLW